MSRKRVLLVFGTRPEAVKMAPVVHALRTAERFETAVCVTAQHRQMLDQVLAFFALQPEFDLDLMRPGQDLPDLTGRVLRGVSDVLAKWKPDLVLVHGDTTTSMAAALAAFYAQIPVGHVEAGLRTRDKRAPFPEEMNRRITGSIADFHFAPTERARANLLAESTPAEQIFVTGNTAIDALFFARDRVAAQDASYAGLLRDAGYVARDRRLVVVTAHRRENFGAGFDQICAALAELAASFADVDFVYPVHLNPNVRGPVETLLAPRVGKELPNLFLIEPLPYDPFVYLMSRSTLLLTDSGGLQEEGPALGKPVLVMRETTERPEAIDAGTARLVGADRERIVRGVSRLLTDDADYRAMATAVNPYGDGTAARQIARVLADKLGS